MSDIEKARKKIAKKYGLSPDKVEEIEQIFADIYAHPTRQGWCCACDADIAFATSYLKDEPEFQALINKVREDEWIKACQDNWQKPISEQYALDRIKTLKSKQGKVE